ncbi:glycosyltransferase [Paenibacillus silviterrae]|uniref:glycosyltransferase n=1 Tax=Paenibacillus silviterrae TaxID=3242194 RepID=UPI002543D473|nr:glycosyltransferase [Paenibacillus chinjuensis]
MIIVLAAILAGVSILLTLWVAWNLRGWPRPAVQGTGEPLPYVSVLVPARNEQDNITRCLESLLRQEYPSYEVICLDDQSEDATPTMLQELTLRFPKLRILHGSPLPEGWVGKCYACHQLAEAAQGEWLLFTDADTVHSPSMLSSLVRTGMVRKAGLVTGFPRIISSHAFGWLVLPMLHFVIALHLPLRFVERSSDPRFVAAHGAYMLYRREAYELIGGHAAHRSSLIEDMDMATAVKTAGSKVSLIDVSGLVGCEMYATPSGVWQGFAKNMFTGLGRSAVLLFALLLFYLLIYVSPLLLLPIALYKGHIMLAALSAVALTAGVLQKLIVDRRFGVPMGWCLLLPVSFISIIALALRSWYLSVRKLGYHWKGRRYFS